LLAGAAAAAAPPPATPMATPAPGVAPAPPAAPAVPSVLLQATPQDRDIERQIASGSRMLTEANEYNQSQPQKNKREPALVNQFYGAGAKRVYFDLGASRAYVQLPDDAAGRAKCFELADAYRAAKGLDAGPSDEGQRYLEVLMVKLPAGSRTR
jgi:hypothetical protein